MRQRHQPRLWLPRPAIRPPISTADNGRPHPGGMVDNSPTFQRWVCELRVLEVPKGRLKLLGSSAVPSRLHSTLSLFPKVETLGYCRVSLREKDLARPLAPRGVKILVTWLQPLRDIFFQFYSIRIKYPNAFGQFFGRHGILVQQPAKSLFV